MLGEPDGEPTLEFCPVVHEDDVRPVARGGKCDELVAHLVGRCLARGRAQPHPPGEQVDAAENPLAAVVLRGWTRGRLMFEYAHGPPPVRRHVST